MGFTNAFRSSIAAALFSGTQLGLTRSGTEINEAGYARFTCGTASTSGSFSTSSTGSDAFTVTNRAKIRMEEATGPAGFGTIDGVAIFSNGTRIFEASTNTITVNYDELPKFNALSISVTIS